MSTSSDRFGAGAAPVEDGSSEKTAQLQDEAVPVPALCVLLMLAIELVILLTW